MRVENGETASEELSKTRVRSVIFLISDNLDTKATAQEELEKVRLGNEDLKNVLRF